MSKNNHIKSLILLSGGLDSLVSLGLTVKEYNVELALTFDYGQKSLKYQLAASKKICEYYGLEHKVIKLDWLKDITKTALVSDDEIPSENIDTQESAKSVWVPNRNGLFLNVAACFSDSFGYDYIIIGANKEEARTFSDNSLDFVEKTTEVFTLSTQKQPKVFAPLIELNKNDIVKLALRNEMPLQLVRSCYNDSENQCGVCESCWRLKNALIANNDEHFIKIIF